MQDIVKSFMNVDTDGDGKITLDDLRLYTKNNQLDSSMVKKWQQLFDVDNTGVITLENFLHVLGVKMQDYVALKKQNLQGANTLELDPDIKVIQAGLPIEHQIDITNEIRRLITADKEDTNHQLTIAIKAFLDLRYGRSWHVVISDGSIRLAFTHLTNQLFLFEMLDWTFAIWQTPNF